MLCASSLRLAPSGLVLRFAPGKTVLRSGGTRDPEHNRFFQKLASFGD